MSAEGRPAHERPTTRVSLDVDGERHFVQRGRDAEQMPLVDLAGDVVVADISSRVGDDDVYPGEMIEDVVDVRERDILFVHTGYQGYAWHREEADLDRFFVKRPGPSVDSQSGAATWTSMTARWTAIAPTTR